MHRDKEPGTPAESPFKGKTGVARIVQAFFNSLAGIADAWRHESAFRQEVALAAVLLPVAAVVPVTPAERGLLVVTVFLVIIVELLNSGVEAAIDRIGLDRNVLSKRAKDLGSAAVLVALIQLVTVWLVVLVPHGV
ncbi:MAG: diacylglycerol kinase [Betaproteobacteria bacterium]|nr:diacylglycerol kinase [Betaproteobacteria bacterium]